MKVLDLVQEKLLWVPFISTHSGGLRDVVEDCTLKIQPESMRYSRSSHTIISKSTQRREMSEKGRKRIEEHFDWKIAAQSYLDVFNKVIKSFNNEHNQIQKS